MASGRHHDDRELNWRIGLSNRRKSVQTADTGHFDIQQNQIKFGFLDEPLQIVSILGYDDLVAFPCEPAGQHVTIHFIVVNDKQSFGSGVHGTFFSAISFLIFSFSRTKSTGLVS